MAEMTDDKKFAKAKARVDDEFAWFDANRDAIIKGHHGQKALIRDHKVLGYYPNGQTACEAAWGQGIEDGDFAVQACITMDEELERYTNTAFLVRPSYA
jgi:hypothetical protein